MRDLAIGLACLSLAVNSLALALAILWLLFGDRDDDWPEGDDLDPAHDFRLAA